MPMFEVEWSLRAKATFEASSEDNAAEKVMEAMEEVRVYAPSPAVDFSAEAPEILRCDQVSWAGSRD